MKRYIIYRHKGYSYYFNKKTEQLAIKKKFNMACGFSSGLGLVKDSEGYYYINKDGEDVFNKRFKEASSFDHGLAIVKDSEGYYYINTLGQDVYKGAKHKSASIFVKGLALVEDEGGYYFINKANKDVFKRRFLYACRFYKNDENYIKAQVIGFDNKASQLRVNSSEYTNSSVIDFN